jgi:hypothetical protein
MRMTINLKLIRDSMMREGMIDTRFKQKAQSWERVWRDL